MLAARPMHTEQAAAVSTPACDGHDDQSVDGA
jgi:hypothetical protein